MTFHAILNIRLKQLPWKRFDISEYTEIQTVIDLHMDWSSHGFALHL